MGDDDNLGKVVAVAVGVGVDTAGWCPHHSGSLTSFSLEEKCQ